MENQDFQQNKGFYKVILESFRTFEFIVTWQLNVTAFAIHAMYRLWVYKFEEKNLGVPKTALRRGKPKSVFFGPG